MTVALNSVSSSPAYQAYAPTSPVVSSPVAASLSSEAAGLSVESAVVASLGGGGTAGVSVYTASGLLDTLQQAGSVTEPLSVPDDGSNVDTSYTAQQALDHGIIATLPAAPSASGIYGGSGTLQGLPSPLASANWAELLKTNPALASSAIADSFNAGFVSSLQVTA